MPIEPGGMLAHYRLVEKIGEGGMGIVWKAVDTQLNREVALKILPDLFASDHDRLGRFRREAQLLASLNHPNIAQIHGLVEAEGVRALALELVDGPTLDERMQSGLFSLPEALPIAVQIAEALETAHDRGIIHRDLKPANIKLTADGQVKVLDFGLAKAMEGEAAADLANSPTLTAAVTQVGVILGTAAYMSPEQAKGKTADRRADIWGFGVVLFEMLAGRRLHAGESVSETLAAVIKDEPDWNTLPDGTPEPIRKLLRRCLEKDPRRRLRDIGEARIALDDYMADPGGDSEVMSPPAGPMTPRWRRILPWAAAGAATLIALAALLLPRGEAPELLRLKVELIDKEQMFIEEGAAAVLSPDGRHIAFVAGQADDLMMLYVRDLDQMEARILSGTEGARNPFFSPDGLWIGFFNSNKLKKVSIAGGAPLSICDAQDSRGGTWGADGTIVFSPTTVGGLMKVSSLGGSPQSLTERDREKNERSHRWPSFLPDGKHVLFMAQQLGGSYEEAAIEVVSIETAERKVVHPGGVYPRYLSSGHLGFLRNGTLFVAPFDTGTMEVTGLPMPVVEQILSNGNSGGSQFDVSRSGTLIYLQGTGFTVVSTVQWVDRQGVATSLYDELRGFEDLRLSPDGRHIALEENMPGGMDIIWVYDIERQTMTRLTFTSGAYEPTWTPDGQRVTYAQGGRGFSAAPNLYWKRADGGGTAERLTTNDLIEIPFSWSPDGRVLAFSRQDPESGWDIWTLTLDEENKEELFLGTPFVEIGPMFSPDGRWIAYHSDESGKFEVYVRPFPGPGGKWQISSGGGYDPRWSGDGRELFFRNGDAMMFVSIAPERDTLQVRTPQKLFEGSFLIGSGVNQSYDVTADGQHFVMLKPADRDGTRHRQVNLVFNWFEEIRRLSASGAN